MHTAYMKMLRAATRQEFDPKASSHPLLDSEVMGISGEPPIHVVFFVLSACAIGAV